MTAVAAQLPGGEASPDLPARVPAADRHPTPDGPEAGGALPVLVLLARDLDDSYVGSRLMLMSPVGPIMGGLTDLRHHGAGATVRMEPVAAPGDWTDVGSAGAVELWLAGYHLIVGGTYRVLVDPIRNGERW